MVSEFETVLEQPVGEERRDRFTGTTRDITDRKLVEASIIQSQKMEAIGRLAGGVSHDFNTLLGTIIGYAELLRDALDGDGPELPQDQIRRFVDKIHRTARRGADLTRQLLAFSRRQEICPQVIGLASITNETADMIRRLIGEDIDFQHVVDTDLGTVSMDPGQLQQVMLNLAVNAADAMPKGGHLAMRWSRAHLHRETPMHGGSIGPGAYALLEVTDSGVGMDEDAIGKIFEPFFTTKQPGKGTGLGLSTVFGIARQWRGGIAVSSEFNRGTTFRIYFPETERERDNASSSATIARPALDRTAGGTVLLVEDDMMFRELVQEVLESNGYEVVSAASPLEAQALCESVTRRVDILVSDLVMPGGNGVDLATSMRSRYPGLRVVLMSGYSDEALASRDLDGPLADAYLEKPFAISELCGAIRQVAADG